MIPRFVLTEWAAVVPWPTQDQVEQDLILSRLMIDIAAHPDLRDELLLRGGTCLHKLHLAAPRRYSEDLDYVRRSAGPIGSVFDSLREVASDLGLDVKTRIGQHPKLWLVGAFDSGDPFRIKIEINTSERTFARDPTMVLHDVKTRWWSGSVDIPTFVTSELVATKLRALYQRRKGRDLFDLWIAITEAGVAPSEIIDCFPPYRPDGYTAVLARRLLREHVAHRLFRSDLDRLAVVGTYDIDEAAALIDQELLSRIDIP